MFFIQMEILSKSHVAKILKTLLKKDRMYYSELTNNMKLSNYGTINLRINELKTLGLVDEEVEDKFGGRRYIWLTPKGKQVAEKLKEIEEILKEE